MGMKWILSRLRGWKAFEPSPAYCQGWLKSIQTSATMMLGIILYAVKHSDFRHLDVGYNADTSRNGRNRLNSIHISAILMLGIMMIPLGMAGRGWTASRSPPSWCWRSSAGSLTRWWTCLLMIVYKFRTRKGKPTFNLNLLSKLSLSDKFFLILAPSSRIFG